MSSNKVKVDGKLEYWSDRYTNQKTGWHQKAVDKFLLKYYKQATGQSLPSDNETLAKETFKENASKTWFVPLCGKTLDIPFLLSLGYKVFAVEGVRQAIETLGSENNLELVYEEANNLFVGAEGRLKIYIGDLFQCPIEQFGPFDYVWDRGSLIAVEYDLRDAYKKMIKRALMDKNEKYYEFVYLLEVVQYDKSLFGGPPRSVDDADMKIIYQDWATVNLLEKVPLPETHSVRVNTGMTDLDELIYLITPKS